MTKSGLRIALLNHNPLNRTDAVTTHILGFARILKGLGNHVEIFVLSDRDRVSKFGDYEQQEINQPLHPDRSKFSYAIDAVSVLLFSKRPFMWIMNHNKKLIGALTEYNPDVIIEFDYILAGLLHRFRNLQSKKPKTLFIVDFYKNMFYAGKVKAEKFPFKELLKSRFVKFKMDSFKKTLHSCDGIVLPSEFFQKKTQNDFPHYKKKIFSVAPLLYFGIRSNKKVRPKTSVEKILYVSPYAPFGQPMSDIRNVIAPALPDKIIVIGGRRCPKKVEKNVHYVGTVKDVYKLIASCDVCIEPNKENSGNRTKVFDYLLENKPVIANRISFAGYNVKDRYNVLIEENVKKFADRIKELDTNKELLVRLQKNAHTALKGRFEPDIKLRWKVVLDRLFMHE